MHVADISPAVVAVSQSSSAQDIVEGKDSYILQADAPGFTPADINVEMNEGVLTVSGKRKEEKFDEKDGKVTQ